MNGFQSAGGRLAGTLLGRLILVLPFIAFLLRLGGAPLFDVDEGAFAEATRERFERGDFLFTYLNGAPRFDKPIFIYWLQSVGYLIFGASEWAFRLPSALAAIVWSYATYFFARRRVGEDGLRRPWQRPCSRMWRWCYAVSANWHYADLEDNPDGLVYDRPGQLQSLANAGRGSSLVQHFTTIRQAPPFFKKSPESGRSRRSASTRTAPAPNGSRPPVHRRG